MAGDWSVEADRWCRRCGCEGSARDSVTRRSAHEPLGRRPTTLLVTVRRYQCTGCGHVWRQDTGRAAQPRAKQSRRALRWALEGLVVQHLTVARIAEGLGVSWNTAADAVLVEGRRVLIDDVRRFDGVEVIGVDEQVWRCTRRGEEHVTVIIDLTPIRDGRGSSRLLDMVEGRSERVFEARLAARPGAWRQGLMDPFHVVRLAGDAHDRCRRRVQHDLHGHRGRTGDPLHRARRTLHIGTGLLTDRRRQGLTAPFATDEHVRVEATRGTYQRMTAAYRDLTDHIARSLLETGGSRPHPRS